MSRLLTVCFLVVAACFAASLGAQVTATQATSAERSAAPDTLSHPVEGRERIADPRDASIRGLIWKDHDRDGTPGEEPGIATVEIELYLDNNADGLLDVGDSSVATGVTDATGRYGFSDLDAGDYLLRVDPRQPAIEYAPLTCCSLPRPVSLAVSEAVSNADFGFLAGGRATMRTTGLATVLALLLALLLLAASRGRATGSHLPAAGTAHRRGESSLLGDQVSA